MLALFDQEDALRRSTKARIGQATKEVFEKGCKEGEYIMAELVSSLLAIGRVTDIERATHDKAFRQKLYQEFGLTIS